MIKYILTLSMPSMYPQLIHKIKNINIEAIVCVKPFFFEKQFLEKIKG